MRKLVDARVRTLIENAVKQRHRSLFIIVGDAGREQVVNLHYMLSKAVVKARPSVLWCYKKELGFTSHRKKRMRQIKKMVQKGLLDHVSHSYVVSCRAAPSGCSVCVTRLSVSPCSVCAQAEFYDVPAVSALLRFIIGVHTDRLVAGDEINRIFTALFGRQVIT